MCYRMLPLSKDELTEAISARMTTGHAIVPQLRTEDTETTFEAFPGARVTLLVPDDTSKLQVQTLTWGFVRHLDDNSDTDARSHGNRERLVYNTRIETAISQAQSGEGMWTEAIRQGRCLVAVRAFWEWWTQPDPQTTATIESTGKQQHRRQVRFSLAGYRAFLIACIQAKGRFSVVTTQANADVSPIHNRMPLVLGPGESHLWLGDGWSTLADRSHVRLENIAEE